MIAHEMRLFLIALQFLTRIRIKRIEPFPEDWLPRCAKYMPLVGALVGGATGVVIAVAAAVFPAPVPIVIGLIASVLLTGALHEDGLADTADALGGGADRERCLQIMKDSRIGTYGVLAIVEGNLSRRDRSGSEHWCFDCGLCRRTARRRSSDDGSPLRWRRQRQGQSLARTHEGDGTRPGGCIVFCDRFRGDERWDFRRFDGCRIRACGGHGAVRASKNRWLYRRYPGCCRANLRGNLHCDGSGDDRRARLNLAGANGSERGAYGYRYRFS